MDEPKKETVRISLPATPERAGSAPSVEKRETTRILLPTRTPMAPIRRLPPKITPTPPAEGAAETPMPRPPGESPVLQPMPKPPGIPDIANNSVFPSVNRGPKKETARISILPRPAPMIAPAINATKTQPSLVLSAGRVQPAPVVITSRPITPIDAIPRPLCWVVFGISAAIFLILIWNYVVS